MNKELLFSFIRQPDHLTVDQNQDLKDMLSNYPYFQSAHLLLLYNLKKINQGQYDQQLRKSSVYVSDRQILFNLLYGLGQESKEVVSSIVSPEIQPKQEKEVPEHTDKNEGDFPELLEIDDNQKVTSSESEVKVERSNPLENINSVYQVPDFELDEESDNASSFDLIEKFIEENPAFVPNRLNLSETREDISESSIVEKNDDLVTETLAKVYTSQKLYDKAISVYEKLILKFPEKSTYFGTRIENLRNNIK